MTLAFRLHAGLWSIARLSPDEPLPGWATQPAAFVAITRTAEELSLVVPDGEVPPGVLHEPGWACLQLAGPFPSHLTGILASFLDPLAAAQVPIFAVSTFDTDWVLVPASQLDAALLALAAAGHRLESPRDNVS